MPGPSYTCRLPDPVPEPPDGYLDAVGGQPAFPAAQQAWAAASGRAWADPARLHHAGRRAGMILDAARASLAASLGVRPAEVFFASSGPVALQAAILGVAHGRARVGGRIVVGAAESMAVISPAQRWAADGGELELVEVDATGRVALEPLAQALARPTALVCVQAANAEVGTRQPIAAIAELARNRGVPLLMDATQVIGHEPAPDGWDLLTASARDWGGPAGVGILVVRPSVRWAPEQTPDRGWVGGFPDIAAAAAAATALEYLLPAAEIESERLRALVGRIRRELPAAVTGVVLAGADVDRLPHILTFTCADVAGEALVTELDRAGISVASGSACTSDARMPSHVLAAMGIAADASVRLSLPFGCTEATVEGFLRAMPGAVATVRARFAP